LRARPALGREIAVCEGVVRTLNGVNDQNWDRAVVNDVAADAPEQGGAHRSATAGAHHDQIVSSAFDLLNQRGADRLIGKDRRDGKVVGHPIACAPEHGFRRRSGIGLHHGERRAAQTNVGGRGQSRDARDQGKAGVLTLCQVDRLS